MREQRKLTARATIVLEEQYECRGLGHLIDFICR
jgi:hypothetical protein